jgi:hypothetical protein
MLIREFLNLQPAVLAGLVQALNRCSFSDPDTVPATRQDPGASTSGISGGLSRSQDRLHECREISRNYRYLQDDLSNVTTRH